MPAGSQICDDNVNETKEESDNEQSSCGKGCSDTETERPTPYESSCRIQAARRNSEAYGRPKHADGIGSTA